MAKYQGYHHYRTKQGNLRERAFVKAYQSHLKKNPNFLVDLLDLDKTGNYTPTDEEYKIAATIIQWLGTRQGSELIEEAIANSKSRIKV